MRRLPFRLEITRIVLALGVLAGPLFGATEAPGHPLFRAYGADQGLTTPSITCLSQDRDGFLWVGTESGLFRYDGTAFQKIQLEGAPSSWIRRVRPARDGGLWLDVKGALMHFRLGKLRGVGTVDRPDQAFRGHFDLDREGRLWSLGSGGCWREREDGLLERLGSLPAATFIRAFSIGQASGTPFALFDNAFQVWDGGRFVPQPVPLRPQENLRAVGEDGEAYLWLLTETRLLCRPAGSKAFHDASDLLPAPFFQEGTLQLDPEGRLWIPTNRGALALRGTHREDFDPQRGLPSRWVRQAFVDREGCVWFIGSSLLRLLGRGEMRAYTSGDGLAGDLVWSLLRDRAGRLWAGTNDGLCLLGSQGWRRIPGTLGTSPNVLQEDSRGAIWAGSTHATLQRIPADGGPARELRLRSGSGLPSPLALGLSQGRPITALLCDRRGLLWIAMSQVGLLKVDPDTGTVLEKVDPAGTDSADLLINKLLQDPAGRIWVASRQGLFCGEGSRWWQLSKELRHAAVLGVAAEGDGVILYYEEPNGLSRVAFQAGEPRVLGHLGTGNGLSSNLVLSTATGPGGLLWVGTDQGLDRLGPAEARHYGRGTGLVGEDCSQGALWVDPGGDVYVGTTQGIGLVLAGREPRLLAPPQTWITQILRGGARILPPFDQDLSITHKENLEFRFAAPSFQDEGGMQFQIRLTRVQPEWQTVAGRNLRCVDLWPGIYHFEARAARRGEGWGAPIRYSFRVLPPWWLTWWFLLLSTGAAVWMLYAFIRWRLRRTNRRNQELDSKNQELLLVNEQKNHYLGIVAHDLRNPLSGIVLAAELLEEEEDLSEVHRTAHSIRKEGLEMSDLIGRLLDYAAIEAGRIKAEPMDFHLAEVSQYIVKRHASGATAKGIFLEAQPFEGSSRVHADLKFTREILDNLVSNAIKFSPPGKSVSIYIQDQEDRMRVSVQDQGPGLTEADRHKLFGRFSKLSARPTGGEKSVGLGLSIVKHLADLMGGRIWVESEPGNGATFQLELPKYGGNPGAATL